LIFMLLVAVAGGILLLHTERAKTWQVLREAMVRAFGKIKGLFRKKQY